MRTVAVLYARADSYYKALPSVEVYDASRDARTFPGGCPVVAHPPCRAWGNFARFAKPRHDEKELALHALCMVRLNGGVLEHPVGSTLWPFAGLPHPAEGLDRWGGFTWVVDQYWWGHKAQKRTRLYIVGIRPHELPPYPLQLGRAPYVIGDVGRASKGNKRPEISKADREHTPPNFAEYLVTLARNTTRNP